MANTGKGSKLRSSWGFRRLRNPQVFSLAMRKQTSRPVNENYPMLDDWWFDAQPVNLVIQDVVQLQTIDNLEITFVETTLEISDVIQLQEIDNLRVTVEGGDVPVPEVLGGIQWHYNQQAVKEYEDEEALVLLMWEMIN